MNVTGDFLDSLNTQHGLLFNAEIKEANAFQGVDILIQRVGSESGILQLHGAGSVGVPTETADGLPTPYQNIGVHKQTITAVEYRDGIEFTRSMIEDDKIQFVPGAVAALARRYANEPRRAMMANVAAGGTTFTGTTLWSSSHTVGAATIDNAIDVNVSVTAAPTLAEMQGAISDAQAKMIAQPDDKNDKSLGFVGNVLMVKPANYTVAAQALWGSVTPGSVSPMPSPTAGLAFSAGGYTIIVNPYLTSDKMYLFHADGQTRPFGWMDRIAPEMSMTGSDTTVWRNEAKVQYSCRMRGKLFFNDPRLGIEVTFT